MSDVIEPTFDDGVIEPDFNERPSKAQPSTLSRMGSSFMEGVREAMPRSRVAPFVQGAVGGTAGLVGGAMELAPGAVGRTGAAISRFGQEQARQAREASPVMGTAGELAPSLLPVGRAVQAGGVLRGAATGAGLGLLTPTGEERGEERVAGKAAGAGLGGLLGAVIPGAGAVMRRAGRAVLGETDPVASQAAKTLRDKYNIQVEPAQVRREAPGSSAGYGASAVRNQENVNRAVSQELGQPSARLTPDYLRDRAAHFAKQYDDIYLGPGGASNPRQFKMDADSLYQLEDIARLEQALPAGAVPAARSIATDMLDRVRSMQAQMPNTRITSVNVRGDELQRLRSELQRIYRTTTDSTDRHVVLDTLRSLDDSVGRNHPQFAARLRELNPQYRAFMTVEDLARKGAVDARGNVDARKMGQYLATNDPRYVRGTSQHPLMELGRLAQQVNLTNVATPAARVEAQGLAPLGRFERFAGPLTRTQSALRAQERLSQPPSPLQPRLTAPTVAGAVGRQIEENQ